MYYIEVRHEGLHKYRLIKGNDKYVVEQKARAQQLQWDEMWARKVERETKRAERQASLADREAKKQHAARLTEEAEASLAQLRGLLEHTLGVNDAIDWNSLKDWRSYPVPPPTRPQPSPMPPEPDPSDWRYQYTMTLGDRLVALFTDSRKKRQQARMRARLERDVERWEETCHDLDVTYRDELARYEQAQAQWEMDRAEFTRDQELANAAVDGDRARYERGDPDAIADYLDLVLSQSIYPMEFPQEYDLEYEPSVRRVGIDYVLPAQSDLSFVKGVRYIQTRDEFRESFLSEREKNKLYDDVLYQVALRTIHEILESDTVAAVDSVVFNGWIHTIDAATGTEAKPCILSLQAKCDEFEAINLGQVEPKACFKKLKGVASSKLHALAPIAPILALNRDDDRIREGREVVEGVEQGTNLAAMAWDDFEHLIRELFEKEFTASGGEVKVTRASRDGGVDAIAFDPDPIRGGKIVIQAKRYTRTVGVAAVRDLYGTVVNEGAIKGILVTTADYGPDAHKFALDKPITLLNGNNLLHLLEKHGHGARIDLREARAK